MKKKFFAVALATTMTVSTAISAMAETKDVTVDAAFSANTGEEVLSGDFDVTYTLNDKSNGEKNWENFIVELHTKDGVGKEGKPVFIDVRADNYGWLANNNDSTEALTFGDPAADWDAWASTMRAGADCKVNVKRSGNTFSYTIEAAGSTFTASVTAADFQGQDVVLYLTGEKCALTNVKFTNNANAGGSGDTKTETKAAGDTKTETKAAGDATATTAAAKADTKTTTPKTGDVAPVAALASLAVVACAGVVVSRKKVTE